MKQMEGLSLLTIEQCNLNLSFRFMIHPVVKSMKIIINN